MKQLFFFITAIWIGLILGLSFIEAPLKFQAPNMTLELGLGIGHLVFNVLNKIEIVLAIGMVTCLFYIKPTSKATKILAGLIVSTLVIQSVFLLPALNQRVELILSGNKLPSSPLHFYFVFGEIGKVCFLSFLFFRKSLWK